MSKQSQKTKKVTSEDQLISHMDLSLSKEYAIYSDAHHVDETTTIDKLIEQSGRLQLNTYQSFIRNLFNPLSEYNSLLLIHGTGTGKTITSLSVAIEYQKQYREFISLEKNKIYDDIHSIVIIGYTKDIFKNELINHPEFGFVSEAEIAELRDYQRTEHESSAISEKLTNLKHKLYRRLSDRRMNGIFKFYGYRQIFNRVINQSDLANKIKSKKGDDLDFSKIDPNHIRGWVRDGSVRINKIFIESLKHSLMICDEVHNIYYQNDVNAYGLSIEIINDYFNEPKLYNPNWTMNNEYCTRWLYLSATPLASSPTEIIPIINLLNSKANRVQYSDLFNVGNKELTPNGLSIISRRVDKHISYIMDDNPIQYPSSSFEGVSIPGITYLKFIRCKMSKPHQEIYNKYIKTLKTPDPNDENFNKSNTLKDFVFETSKHSKGAQKNELTYRYTTVSDELKANKSPYKEDSNGLLISNTFNTKTLGLYSAKYLQIIEHILKLKSADNGKIFVYHPYVQSTGTNLLASIFKENGLLENDDQPLNNSICMNCNKLFKEHKCTKNDHCEFTAVRFIIITGYISKAATSSRLSQFNSAENSNGKYIKLLLGSKAMRESHTLKACRHLMVAHQPSSISELIQIIGRGVRKNSHSLLDSNDRNIKLYIFVSSLNGTYGSGTQMGTNSGNELSTEENDYYDKMRSYKQILTIERILFNQSLDYLINFRFKRRDVPKLIGEAFSLDMDLYNEYNTMKSYPISRMGRIKSNTFYFTQEVSICTYLIKRILFEYQPVVLKSILINIIRNPPFSVDADVSLLSDEAIESALYELIYDKATSLIIDDTNKNTNSVDSLFNNSKLIISPSGKRFYIKCDTSFKDMRNNDILIYADFVKTPVNDLHKLITISEPNLYERQIDLEELSNHWNDLVQIDDIIAELQIEFKKNSTIQGQIVKRIDQFTLETHMKLIEYCIIAITSKVFYNKKITIDIELLIQLMELYQDKNILITIRDTANTIIQPLYKRYIIYTGSSWQDVVRSNSKITKINYSTVPIGHYVKYQPRIINIESLNKSIPIWNEYSSIVKSNKWVYPYKLYGYEDRGANIDSIFKIKDITNKSSTGINPMFMQQTDLRDIAKRLHIKTTDNTKKSVMVDQIKHAILALESKYRQGKTDNKIYFYPYETRI